MLDKEILRRFDRGLLEQLNDCYKNKKVYVNQSKGIEIYHEPFTHCIISDLLVKEEFVSDLKKEMVSKLKYLPKNNDLYKFQQTSDLSKCSAANISRFRDEILYGSLLGVLKQLTGIELSPDKIDVTSSKYETTDYLLCHDDDIHDQNRFGRRIAFIYYLVPPEWDAACGGNLDLFKVDADMRPIEIVKSIVPKNNRLLFFEVSDRSFHQVAEVFNNNTSNNSSDSSKARYSINGWFHGPVNLRPKPTAELLPQPSAYGDIDPNLFFDWIIERYLKPINQTQIQMKFANSSEIKLDRIFHAQQYESVSEALGSKEIEWKRRGPYNKRNYEVANLETVPQIVKDLVNVLTSDFMGLTLSNMTGLALHSSAPKIKSDREVNEEDDDDDDDGDDEEDEDDEEEDDEEDDFDDEGDEDEADEDEEDEEDSEVRPSTSGLNNKRKRDEEDDDDDDDDDGEEDEDEDEDENDEDDEDENDEEEEEKISESKPGTSSSLLRSENLYKKFKTSHPKGMATPSSSATCMNTEENGDDEEDKKHEEAATAEAATDDSRSKPRCYCEVRRWKQGHYTLITDDDDDLKTKALDLMVFFKCKSWTLECGGNISYIARDEDNELLTVNPEENCISLVYRDEETLKFTKYVNSKINKLNSDACFYEISVVYYE